jgi:hypothetical protein
MRGCLRSLVLVPMLLPLACGDGGPKFVRVSGRITMDNLPLAGAKIGFQPMASEGGIATPGPGSIGETDDDGNYSLKVIGQSREGAVIGTHRIEINKFDRPIDSSDDRGRRNLVPARYNLKTILTFPVPPEGTTEANFSLTGNP